MNKKFYIFFSLLILLNVELNAQKKAIYDSLPKLDSITHYFTPKTWLLPNAPTQKIGLPYKNTRNDKNFLIAIVLLGLFAIIKSFFPKYISEIWQITFRNTFRVASLKAQISGNLAGSLLMNIFFCFVVGCFIHLLLQYNAVIIINNWWMQLLLCICILGIIYCIKLISILFFGAVFQQKKQSSDYIFIVFLCNKIMAILLLPFVAYLLITNTQKQFVLVIAIFIISLLLIYRIAVSLITIAKQLHLQKLHFFMYLCATEIAPLLVVYKLLLANSKIVV